MNAQLTRMTVPLRRIAQTSKARLSAPVLMALKETEPNVTVIKHIENALQCLFHCTLISIVPIYQKHSWKNHVWHRRSGGPIGLRIKQPGFESCPSSMRFVLSCHLFSFSFSE